jgi:hypothetical protein
MKKLQLQEQKRKELLLNNQNKINTVILKEREAYNKVLENSSKLNEVTVVKQNRILAKQFYSMDRALYKEDVLVLQKQDL